ncbi:MAG TPA: FG-GAP-like repeat-containing protein, partial [Bacteroidia bacterium]
IAMKKIIFAFAFTLVCTFAKAQTTPCFPDTNLYVTGSTAISVATADFNNDGFKDIVSVNQNGGHYILMSDGVTGFTTTFISGAVTQNYVVTALFNADNFQDYAISNGTGADVYLGNGDGTFVASLNAITSASASRSLAADDYNADGIIDIAVLEATAAQFEIFLGTGTGAFSLGSGHATGATPAGIMSGYFDSDAFVDLAIPNSGNNTLSVFFGAGDGSFGTDSVFTTDAFPYFLSQGDYNNDGFTDIAVANFGASSISVFSGTGTGSFSLSGTHTTGANPTEIASGDLNGDGNLDLVSIGLGSNVIHILTGDGNGIFNVAVPYAVNGIGVSVRIDDLHNNGLLDIVAGHLGGMGVTVLTNQLPDVSITATPASKVCAGDSVKLTAIGAHTYTWSHGIENDEYFTPGATATYTVVALDTITGCSSLPGTKTITYYPLPDIGVSVTPNDTVCSGEQITLTGTGGLSYTFTAGVNDGSPFNIDSTQTFTVTGQDAAFCSNTDSIKIVVRSLPDIGISATPNDTVCTGDVVTLNGTGGVSYVFSGTVADGLPFQVDSTAMYTVIGEDAFHCFNIDSIQIVAEICVGLNELVTENAIHIYPNPAVSVVNVSNLEKGDQLIIADMIGKNVIVLNATDSSEIINISELHPALYLVHRIHNGQRSVSKLIVR